ncbi:MAG TPA: hypothetical protein VFH68_15305 [Polyangia bacterium]|jgi:hypothetical protein|nr:hypothetical protein [Polyangia bacterium]
MRQAAVAPAAPPVPPEFDGELAEQAQPLMPRIATSAISFQKVLVLIDIPLCAGKRAQATERKQASASKQAQKRKRVSGVALGASPVRLAPHNVRVNRKRVCQGRHLQPHGWLRRSLNRHLGGGPDTDPFWIEGVSMFVFAGAIGRLRRTLGRPKNLYRIRRDMTARHAP